MISTEDLKKLATLSRLAIPEAELSSLQKDIEGVLVYVEKLNEVSTDAVHELPSVRNVFRVDAEPHASGEYTEQILANAPGTEGGYLKVKKIL